MAEAPQGMVTISDVVEPNSNGSSDFDPAKGALSAEFTIQVNDNSMENLVVSIGETVLDMAGNNLVPASDNLQTVDTVNPDVTGASNDVAEGVKVSDVDPEVVYTITFSEAIDSLSAADLDVTGAAISDVTLDGDGESATVTVVADDNSEAPITVSVRDSVTDIVGNIVTANVSSAQAVDTVNPVASVEANGINVDDNILADAEQPVTYTVQFSEPVQAFGEADIDTAGNGVVQADTIALVLNDNDDIVGASFNVIAKDAFDGELTVTINNSVVDLNGNTLDPNNITIDIDTLNPTVSVALANKQRVMAVIIM